jgi:integrase
LRPAEAIVLIHTAAPHLRPLLAFAVATGARPAEYLELTWQDVDLRGKRVTLRTKGGGFRHYDMPPIAIAALEAIKHRKGPVFLTPKGTRHRDTDREGGG